MKSVIFLLVAALVLVIASCGDTGSQPNDAKFTVNYHANGVSVSVPAAQKASAGSTVYVAALPGTVPAGKIFNGWNTQADGDGDLHTPGAPMVVDKDIDLYAEWSTSSSVETNECTIEMVPHSTFDLYIDYYPELSWGQVCQPLDWDGARIASGQGYIVTYSFKSDVAIQAVTLGLVDASGVTGKSVVRLVGSGSGDFSKLYIEPNTPVSGEFKFLSTSNAANDSEMANSIFITATQTTAQKPTLTFTELTLQKTERINIVSVVANGSPGVPTTNITFTFDKPVTGLSAGDFGVGASGFLYNNISVTKTTLEGSGWIYVLSIIITDNSSSPFDTEIPIKVNVSKRGYSFFGNTQSISIERDGVVQRELTAYTGIAPPPPPPTRVIFNSVTANGNDSQTTTQLTLSFAERIDGLNSNDIVATLNGVPVTKGILSSSTSSTYTLPISGFTTGGTLRVSVSKAGYTISGSPKTTTIFRDYNSTPAYIGFLGRGYDVLNSPYYQSGAVKSQPALNMRKLKAEGKLREDRNSYRQTSINYTAGETLSKYAEKFATNVGLSASAGFFSASASFGYSSSNSAESKRSFASCISELTKVKEYLDQDTLSIGNIMSNYLLDNFKTNWLLNPSVTPAELFRNYGTHIFLEVYLGGRMDMSFDYDNTKITSSQDISASLSASYLTVSGSVDVATSNQASQLTTNSKYTINAYGGSTGIDLTTFDNAKSNYGAWANSIETTSNLALIKGGDLGSITQMIPIWELIDTSASAANQTRYGNLITAYRKQLEVNGGELFKLQKDPPIPTYLKEIRMGVENTEALAKSSLQSQLGLNVNIVDGDLNRGLTNKPYILLGYSITTNVNEAITDIIALNNGENTVFRYNYILNNMTYYEFGSNANKGASKDNIGLYYTKETKSSKTGPIKNIFVEIEGRTSGMEEAGGNWTRVKWTGGGDANMNSGAGGKVVYIWMQR